MSSAASACSVPILHPWDIYDLSNEDLLAAYTATAAKSQSLAATGAASSSLDPTDVLLAAMEKEMKERSLSYAVVHRLSVSIDAARPSAEAAAAPSASTPTCQLLRPPWFVEGPDVLSMEEVAQGVSGEPAPLAPSHRYRTMWDDQDEEVLGNPTAEPIEEAQNNRRRRRRRQSNVAVMNKLGFFEVVSSSSKGASARKKAPVEQIVTQPHSRRLTKTQSTASVGKNIPAPAPGVGKVTMPHTGHRRMTTSKSTLPPPSSTRTVPPSPALNTKEEQKHLMEEVENTTTPVIMTETTEEAVKRQGVVASEEDSIQGLTHTTTTTQPLPSWLSTNDTDEGETSSKQPSVVPQQVRGEDDSLIESVDCRRLSAPQEPLVPPVVLEAPRREEDIPAMKPITEDDGDMATADWRLAQNLRLHQQQQRPPSYRSGEESGWVEHLDTAQEQFEVPVLVETVISDSSAVGGVREKRTGTDIIAKSSSSLHRLPLEEAAVAGAMVPRMHFSSVSGAADYSSYFPTLAHLLIDPSHLFCFASQPLAVIAQAVEMLKKSTQQWVDEVLKVQAQTDALNSTTFSADAVLASRCLFKVQQDREEVRELLSMVLTEGELVCPPWIEVCGWEEDDDEDEDEDSSSASEQLWRRLLSTGKSMSASAVGGNNNKATTAGVAPDVWTLWWTWGKPRPRPDAVWLATQLVNHIPKSSCLTRKDLLKTHVQRHNNSNSSKGNSSFSMAPLAAAAPASSAVKRSATPSNKSNSNPTTKLTRSLTPSILSSSAPAASSRRLPLMPLTFTLPSDYVDFASCFAATGGTWILKTVGMSRGRGIRLVRSIEDVVYSDVSVIQRYIDRPLLIDGGYKFDLRLYVLVTQFSPTLEAYISTLGFFRIASRRYEGITLKKKEEEKDGCGPRNVRKDLFEPEQLYAHLTNTSISNDAKKKKKTAVAGGFGAKKPREGDDEDDDGSGPVRQDCKWTLDEGRRYLETKTSAIPKGGSWERDIWLPICTTILRVLVSVQDAIPPPPEGSSIGNPTTFELFGFDVLLDEDLTPWVLEVNASPSMEVEGSKDMQVKPRLIRDIVTLLDPIPVDRRALLSLLKQPDAVKRFFSPTSKSSAGSSRREVDAALHAVLQGRVPRRVGKEVPAKEMLGSFQVLAPSERYDAACKWKRSM